MSTRNLQETRCHHVGTATSGVASAQAAKNQRGATELSHIQVSPG